MAIQTVTINVEAQPTADRIQTFLVLSQNENGRQIRFRILGDELPAGCTATLSGEKPDGNVWSKAGSVHDNFVTVNEDIQMTAVAGRWDAQLDIVHGSENIVTAPIRITIEPASVDAGAVPSDTQLEGYVEQCKQYAETAKDEAYGSPLTAATAAAMTDQKRVYVYTGSETGYTAGHWYYYNGSAWTDGGVYNSVAVDTDTTLSISGKAADAKKTGDEIDELKSGFNELYNTAYVTDSASGRVAHFVDGADDVPMKSLKVSIEPVQSGSGDPSPDNVRPISGFNSVKVTRAGKNLLPMEVQSGSYGNGVTITVNPDLSITYNKPNDTNWTTNSLGTLMLQAGTYTLIENADGSQNARISLKKLPDNTEIVNTRWNKKVTFTLTEATQIYADFSRAAQATDLVIKFMIFKGNTATASDYEPYKGNTYDISLASAGTVYGGTLDVTSGVLTVDRAMVTLDGTQDASIYNWRPTPTSVGAVFPRSLTNNKVYRTDESVPNIVCDKLKTTSYNTAYNGESDAAVTTLAAENGITAYGICIRIPDVSATTATAMKQYLASNTVTVTYELATPITYKLTPAEVKSLLGVNNIWSNAGDVTAEYRADMKLYIKRLTDSDTDMVADSNITSGQYFMVGNDLYRATVNIASGSSVIVGTNATKVSLATALNEINA